MKANSSGRNGSGPSYDLSTRAMLSSVEVHAWTGRRMDKKASQDVARKYDLGERTGRYYKWLLLKDETGVPPDELVAVHNAGNAARVVHYEHTLPWADDGARILPVSNFLPWASAVREKQFAFDDAVKVFVEAYPGLKQHTEEIMTHYKRGLFRADDYPDAGDLARRFSMRIKHFPLPSANDFRVDISAPQAEAIRQQIERDLQVTVHDATADLFKRLGSIAERVAKLSNPKGSVRDSLADDVDDMCKLVARLNLTGNPTLEEFRLRVEKELAFDPGTVRRMRGVRNSLASRAEKIYDDLAGFVGE